MRNATALAALLAAGWGNEVAYDFGTLMLWREVDRCACDCVPWPAAVYAQWVNGAVLVTDFRDDAIPLADLGLPPVAAQALASFLFDLAEAA